MSSGTHEATAPTVAGPGLVAAKPAAARRDEPQLDCADFVRKCNHARRTVSLQPWGGRAEDGNAWALAFSDEYDPVPAMIEWMDAGWRDPMVVLTAVRICGSRENAEACMSELGLTLDVDYEPSLISALAAAMTTLSRERDVG